MGLNVSAQNVTTFSRRARWDAYRHGLLRELQIHPPDVIHSHVPISNLVCHRLSGTSKIPWVATVHSSWRIFGYAPQTVHRPYLRPYFLIRHALGDRITLRSAARVAAISEYVKRELVQIGVPERKINTIHDGLPVNMRPLAREAARVALKLPANAIVIGSLGFFAPVKGFDLLIQAFAELAPEYPDLLLLIAGGDVLGDDAYRHLLSELIQKHKLEARVKLLGSVEPKAGFLSALDVFVVASRSEGFSLSLVEAMQHALPSVVTSAGGSGEAARHEQEALVFKSGDIADLSSRLKQLVIDQSMREKLGHAARQRAETYLSLERCVNEYEQFYDTVS